MSFSKHAKELNWAQAKIVATMGPACRNEEFLASMMRAGMNVCRLNFSHGDYDFHAETIRMVRRVSQRLGVSVGILADLQGPKIRVGEVAPDTVLKAGQEFFLTTQQMVGNVKGASIGYMDLPRVAHPGEEILIDDGKIRLQVEGTNGTDRVETRVVNGGPLSSRKGVNLPNTYVSLPSMTEKDRNDAVFALRNDVDWIALSFVRNPLDMEDLRTLVKEEGKEGIVSILAKIEKPEVLNSVDEVIDHSDGIMVARGDLGVEVSFEQVPVLQKEIIRRAVAKGKPVIVATQMLESMIHNFAPTRAEANDVANAVLDGADAVMLSGETSVGAYPVESVQAMSRIIRFTENRGFSYKPTHVPDPTSGNFTKDVICHSAVQMADNADVEAIVLFVEDKQAVQNVVSYRPNARVFVFTTQMNLERQFAFTWGVKVFPIEAFERTAQAVAYANAVLLQAGLVEKGDRLIYLSHIPFHQRGEGMNTIRLENVQ